MTDTRVEIVVRAPAEIVLEILRRFDVAPQPDPEVAKEPPRCGLYHMVHAPAGKLFRVVFPNGEERRMRMCEDCRRGLTANNSGIVVEELE